MKKIFLLILVATLLLPAPLLAATKTTVKHTVTNVKKQVVVKKTPVKPTPKPIEAVDLVGWFLIQKESYGRLWYVNPQNKKRYIIQNDDDLKKLLDTYAIDVGVDLDKMLGKVKNAPNKKYAGKIVMGGKSKGYWYVGASDLKLYRIDTFAGTYKTMRVIGKSVSDVDLRKVQMNSEQLTFDSAFPAVAYVKYDGTNFSDGYNNKTILPLASLTKVMTALVLLDQNLDLESLVTITSAEINYPKTLVGDDGTSEIGLRAGDTAKMSDLWIAMLSASSNQSAAILADNSGLNKVDFVKAMNDKAKLLGLTKTVFHEYTGLDFNNISTPEEMAVLGSVAFSSQKISDATNVVNYTFLVENEGQVRDVNVKNRNYSLLAFNPEASKTGFLVEARSNVILKKDGNIVVVLHAAGLAQRNEIVRKLIASTALSYNK